MDPRISATPVIAIVGRTNVGKSTLFNRLLGERKAITSVVEGTTRDINFGHCHWRDLIMTVIDTAGLDLTSVGATEEDLARQARMALAKADLILFLVDVKAGLLPQDRALARELKRAKKTVFLTANKADNPASRREADAPEWMKLGFGRPNPVSAANGAGVGDLLDLVCQDLARRGLSTKPIPEVHVRATIIGRPNVGKSSLLNALAGEPRVIVSEVPHTTREPQDTLLTYEDSKLGTKYILLVDTVGIRKRARVAPGLEKSGVSMSLKELERADVVVLVIDATAGVELQEKKLAAFADDRKTGLIFVVNKWDLAEKKELGTAEDFQEYVMSSIPTFHWAPLIFMSAKSGNRVGRLPRLILDVAAQRERVIPQEQLDKFVEALKKRHHAVAEKGGDRFGKIGKRPHVYGITQVGSKPPVFMVVVKDKETLHVNFLRFVENRMRDAFGFEGTAIKVIAREIS